MLSALVATSARADLLILLSDVDGLYTSDPNKDKSASLISEVGCVTPDIEKLAGKASSRGSGGMATKVRAARIACESGIPVVIAKSDQRDVLKLVLAGKNLGTIFFAREKK
jgi:glutamate 5-kinase